MLFSSQSFILFFLPLTLAAYYGVGAARAPRLAVLLLASLTFYGCWDPRFLPLLAVTIVGNWLAGRALVGGAGRAFFVAAVAANLAVLGLFKYANFLAEGVLTLAGVPFEPWDIVLPLGVSFFTFQHISYLVDLRRGDRPRYGLVEYACFVCFFPHLVAGPIVRHHELIPEFVHHPPSAGSLEPLARGAVLFVLGLVKKVFLADDLAPIADAGFAVAADGDLPGVSVAWQSALAYTLQLYFDFSAYSDMAMGLFGLFGFHLPLNFDRPYRATSIRDFWRRWHMTLSRFLRDYVYIPLGGSRHGVLRTYAAALATMLLCGLWHGAGWTFVAWGGLHGLAVVGNRAWAARGWPCPPLLGWLATLVFVVVGWVLFRAADFAAAARMLAAMAGAGSDVVANDDGWYFVAVAAAFAVLGPSNAELAARPRLARRRVALPVALALVACLMRVGQGRGLEFIYFQF